MDFRLLVITLSLWGLVWTGFLPGQPTTHDPMDMIDTLVKMTLSVDETGILNVGNLPVDRSLLNCAAVAFDLNFVYPCTWGPNLINAAVEKCFLEELFPAPPPSQPSSEVGLLSLLYASSLDDGQTSNVLLGSSDCWQMHVGVPTGLVEGILTDTNVTKNVLKTFIHKMMNGDNTTDFLSLRGDLRNTKMAMCYFRHMMLNGCLPGASGASQDYGN